MLSDGQIRLGNAGEEFKSFHARDGLGIKLAQKAGIRVVLITGRKSEIVTLRAKELGIEDVYQGIDDKWRVMQSLMAKYHLKLEEIAYMGDDLNDLGIITRVGLGATVADGVPEVKKFAAFVAKANGGSGAMRELIELILKAQHRWEGLISQMI